MVLIIYLLGFLVSYIMMKCVVRRGDNNTWGDVFATFFLSCTSWIGFLIMLFLFMETIKNKPIPKWLRWL